MRARPSVRLRRVALAASAAVLVAVSSAHAATVANPGPLSARFTSGQLTVMDGQLNLSFSEATPVVANGTIDANGNVSVPAAGVSIPSFDAVVLGLPVAVQLGPLDVS